MKTKLKRPLALLLCLMTVLSVLPGGVALAAEQCTMTPRAIRLLTILSI